MACERVLSFLRVITIRLPQMKQNGTKKALHVAVFSEDLYTYINFKSQGLIGM